MHYDPGEFEEPSDGRWAASNVLRQAIIEAIRDYKIPSPVWPSVRLSIFSETIFGRSNMTKCIHFT